jgi:hypothetical protein
MYLHLYIQAVASFQFVFGVTSHTLPSESNGCCHIEKYNTYITYYCGVRVCDSIYISIYLYMSIFVSIYVCVHTLSRMYVCMCVLVCVCVCVRGLVYVPILQYWATTCVVQEETLTWSLSCLWTYIMWVISTGASYDHAIWLLRVPPWR